MSASDKGLAPTPGPDDQDSGSGVSPPESEPSSSIKGDAALSNVERRVAWRASDERRRMFRNAAWALAAWHSPSAWRSS